MGGGRGTKEMIKEAYYFPHDSNARNDEKCLFIISKYGAYGYGVYWMFIECMHEQIDGKLTCFLMEGLSLSFNTDITLLKQFYNDAITAGLFVTDGVKYWSERVLRNKEELQEKRNKKSEAGKRGMKSRWENNNTVITKNNDDITHHNKGKESKVNKSKEKESKVSQEKYTDPTTPFKFFEDNFDSYTLYEEQEIKSYIEIGMEPIVITSVMKMSKIYGAKSWSYVKKALDEKLELGIKTIAQWELYEANKKEKKVQKPAKKEEACPYRYED